MQQFMTVTAHWLSANWEMETVMLAFEDVSNMRHTGENFANALLKVTDNFGITSKVLYSLHSVIHDTTTKCSADQCCCFRQCLQHEVHDEQLRDSHDRRTLWKSTSRCLAEMYGAHPEPRSK